MKFINEIKRLQQLAGINESNNSEDYLQKSINLINIIGLNKMKKNYRKLEISFLYEFGDYGEIDIERGDEKDSLKVDPLSSSELQEHIGYLDEQLNKVQTPKQLCQLISDRSNGVFDSIFYKEVKRASLGKTVLD